MPSEDDFLTNRAVIGTRIEECITVAELLLGLSSETHGCVQSINGDLGFGPTADQQMIDNWVYQTDTGQVTLEVSIAPSGPDWRAVVTVTTTDGISEVFLLDEYDYDPDDFPVRPLLLDLLKRFARPA